MNDERGVCVTSSSLWMIDGSGWFRRGPRWGVPPSGSGIDLVDGTWVRYRHAAVEQYGDDLRLRVVPASRREGSAGICSGAILWTNLTVPDGRYVFGPATEWFPPSPVPADRDLWPGELPFTAFGQYGPDSLDLRVFDQDVYWVDRTGTAHRLDEMSDDYVTNVLRMLVARVDDHYAATMLRTALQVVGDTLLGRVSGELLAGAFDIGTFERVRPEVWLRATPLFRRLAARIASAT